MEKTRKSAVKIVKYISDKGMTSGGRLKVAEIKAALRFPPDDFEQADTYLLEGHYVEGTMGGDDGKRWLTKEGIDWLSSEEQAASFWHRNRDRLLVDLIIGIVTFALGLVSGLLLK